jgi:hypothetical protein
MEKGHRCEALVDSLHHKIDFVEEVGDLPDVDEYRGRWKDGEISYRLNNFSDDFNENWQTRAVTVALRAWKLRIKNIYFRRERNPNSHVDINVSWENLSHFDNRKGVLAHAYFPSQGDISGDCHINDEWNYVAGTFMQSLSKPPLVPILIHEFGHSLGLRHDTYDRGSIMYPSFNLGQEKYRLGPRDVSRMQEKYGARNLSQRIIDYFAFRRYRGADFR